MAAKGREGKPKQGKMTKFVSDASYWSLLFSCGTEHMLLPTTSSRLYQLADEVALGEDDRGAAGLAHSLQAQQFAALTPDEYGV